MPKIVDHDARREEVLAAFHRVVRREGVDATTIREIAAEAGCSSGVLAHYFRDKDDILRSALDLTNRQMGERVQEVLSQATGIDALRVVLQQTLPLDEERSLGLHLEVGMWGRAISRDSQREIHQAYYELWFGLIVELVRGAVEAGDLPPGIDLDLAALSLVAFVDGLAVDALMHPDRLPPERQLRLLDAQLDGLVAFA